MTKLELLKAIRFFPYTLSTLMHECINLFLNGVFIKPDNFVLLHLAFFAIYA